MYMRSRSYSRSSSSHPRYVLGQGTHSMSDSPYYDQFPEERKKLKTKRTVVKKTQKKTMKKSHLKPCPASKVRNPKTNRCINKTGRLAKTLKKKGKL